MRNPRVPSSSVGGSSADEPPRPLAIPALELAVSTNSTKPITSDGKLPSEMQRLFTRFQSIQSERNYYHIVITAEADGFSWYVQLDWAGWEDEARNIRRWRARAVNAEWIAETWKQSGHPFLVANDVGALAVFFACGGDALVDVKLAALFLPDVIERRQAGKESELMPVVVMRPSQGRADHAPSPSLRRKVLQRDREGCRICGDAVTPQTAVMRCVRPAALGGAREARNLISLCPRCASALMQPGARPKAFVNIGSVSPFAEILRYRDWLTHEGTESA